MDSRQNNIFFEVQLEEKKDVVRLQLLKEYDESKVLKGKIDSDILKAVVDEGKKWNDIIFLQDTSNFAISEMVMGYLEKSRLTGWKSVKLQITNTELPYYCFQVLSECGELTRPSTPGFVKGMAFDIATWDGSDFFSPRGTNLILCTNQARTFFSEHKIKDISFVDIREVEWYSI